MPTTKPHEKTSTVRTCTICMVPQSPHKLHALPNAPLAGGPATHAGSNRLEYRGASWDRLTQVRKLSLRCGLFPRPVLPNAWRNCSGARCPCKPGFQRDEKHRVSHGEFVRFARRDTRKSAARRGGRLYNSAAVLVLRSFLHPLKRWVYYWWRVSTQCGLNHQKFPDVV